MEPNKERPDFTFPQTNKPSDPLEDELRKERIKGIMEPNKESPDFTFPQTNKPSDPLEDELRKERRKRMSITDSDIYK